MRLLWDAVYRVWAPWDVSEPPTELERVLAEDRDFERALDLGCGTGRLTAYLAHCGLGAHGIDVSAGAIETARERPQDATFHVADVTDTDAVVDVVPGAFDLVVDFGCLHFVPRQDHPAYRDTLLAVTHPGSTYLLWTLPDRSQFPLPRPRVTEPDVEGLFAGEFVIERQRETSPRAWATAPYTLEFYRMRRR